MSVMEALSERFQSRLKGPIQELRSRLFGVNNEKLDFLMDSFYKLTPSQRMGALGGVIGVVVVFLLLMVWLYFSQVSLLKREWDQSILALKELERKRQEMEVENRSFDQMASNLSSKTSTFHLRPFLEGKAKEFKIQSSDFGQEKSKPMSSDDPLSERFNEIRVETRLSKISLPRLIKFLVDIESSGNFLRVEALQINGRHETEKLYFDAKTSIRGYKAK